MRLGSSIAGWVLGGAVLVLGVGVAGVRAAERPNVVVILADDLGYADLGVQGCTDFATPHIDRLAASGIRFTNGYSSHPYCSPMRAGLMACRYQHRVGHETNVAYDPQNPRIGLPVGVRTVADRLKAAGYRTGVVGKWHLGAGAPFHPNKRGFDFFYGFLGGGHDYFEVDLLRPMHEGYFQPLLRNGEPENFEGYLTDVFTEEAVRFVERSRDRPFFLYLAYNAPHAPMQAPPKYLTRFPDIADQKRRTYAAMVSAVDDGVGAVMGTLERLGLRDKTIVFFLSDNGGPTRANASRNDPLRGFKGDMYEGGIRVPFLASWPGTLPAEKVYDEPVISLDIARTALAVAGASQDGELDGVNLLPYVMGERQGSPHEALFWRRDNGAGWAVRAGKDKLFQTKPEEPVELHDLAVDIGEKNNLLETKATRVKELHALYDTWNQGNVPPAFPGYGEYHRAKNAFYEKLSWDGREDD